MMSRSEQLAARLTQIIGPFDMWDNVYNYTRTLRLQDGREFTLSGVDMAMLSEEQLLRHIIDLVAGRDIEESKTFLLEEDTTPDAKRLAEINRELDILRGVVPTPKGYTIDPARAKDLMAELRALMKRQASRSG